MVGQKNSGNAVDALNRTVDPWPPNLPCCAINPETGLSIVQACEDQIGPREEAEAAVLHDVGRERLDGGFRQKILISVGDCRSLGKANIRCPEEY